MLSGLKTIISTGTRALQDQLYHRDLPRVRNALGVGLKSALLKGRANYPVSYTHLDVYKRQGFNRAVEAQRPVGSLPVSYTHLDVYKRQ